MLRLPQTCQKSWAWLAVALLGVLLGALLGPANAQAQGSGNTTSAPAADSREYQAAIDRAVDDYAAGRYEPALAGFERAHALQPSARTLRGIGLAAYYLGERTRARVALEAALADARKPLPDDQRRDVQALLDSGLRAPDAEDPVVQVAPVPSTPDPVSPPPSPPPPSPSAQPTLQPSTPLAQPVEPAVTEPTPVAPARAEPSDLFVTWIAAGAVPVFAGAAAAVWFTGAAKHDAITKRCEDEGCTHDQAVRRADDAGLAAHETWTNVCLVSAGVALVTASIAFVLESGGDTGEASHAGLSWTAQGPSTTLRTHF